MVATTTAGYEEQLIEKVVGYARNRDFLGFARWAFPWGEADSVLMGDPGLDPWQIKVLSDITYGLQHGKVFNQGRWKDCSAGIHIAVSSGHGIGKSALMAILDHAFMSMFPEPQIVTTANTKNQLTSKTGREQSIWYKRAINSHWFVNEATKTYCKASPNTWFSSFIPFNESNPEAFAGTHAKHTLIKMDEASAIPPVIWETLEGAMTDVGGVKIWIVFGNPTRVTGRFADCFTKNSDRWLCYNVNAEESPRTNKKLFEKWAYEYGGRDSDFYKVRVLGEFPSQGDCNLMDAVKVRAAAGVVFPPEHIRYGKRHMGVDCARSGKDFSSIAKRQGLAATEVKRYHINDAVKLAAVIKREIDDYKPHQVTLDMGSIGAAVYDILTGWGYDITPVWFSGTADEKNKYKNKRAEMWVRMRDAIYAGGAIPNSPTLIEDLVSMEFFYGVPLDVIQLEPKEDFEERVGRSPDEGDALALTYAYPLTAETPKEGCMISEQGEVYDPHGGAQAVTHYDLLGRRN